MDKSLIIKELKNLLNIKTDTEFADYLGIKQNTLSGWKTRNTLDYELIISKCENVNANWLITGTGNILNETSFKGEINSIGLMKSDRRKTIQSVPLYSITATAGIVDLLSDHRQKHIPSDYISIPNLPKCDGAVPITGDSMYPLLKSGDLALYKEVHDFENIIWGEMYLIALSHKGDDFFFAKYVQKGQKIGWVNLVSHNQNHQAKEFPIDSIKALALIKASVRINTQF